MLEFRTLFNAVGVGSIMYWLSFRFGSHDLNEKLVVAFVAYWIGLTFGTQRSDRYQPTSGEKFDWILLTIEAIPLACIMFGMYLTFDIVAKCLTSSQVWVDILMSIVGGFAFCASRKDYRKISVESQKISDSN